MFGFITVLLMCVSQRHFTDDVEDPYADGSNMCLKFGIESELRVRFRTSKTGLSLLTVSRRFLCCSSFLFVRLWFHIRRLFGPHFILIVSDFNG